MCNLEPFSYTCKENPKKPELTLIYKTVCEEDAMRILAKKKHYIKMTTSHVPLACG